MHGDAAIAGLTCILEDNLRSHREDVCVAIAVDGAIQHRVDVVPL
jgi:hypothetical protein